MKKRKLVAPIVVTVIMVAYYAALIGLTLWIPGLPWGARVAVLVIGLALSGVIIAMLRERIHEIRSGEEDDLSQY